MMFKDWRTGVAARYFVSSASDSLVSLISFISITGLILGVAVLVIVLSVMNGFDQELRTRVLGVVPHGVIYNRSPAVHWQNYVKRWRNAPEVEAIAPVVEGNGLLLANGKMVGTAFTGIDPKIEPRVSIIQNYFVSGDFNLLKAGEFGVILGEALAARLGVAKGDKVTLILPDLAIGFAGPIPRMKRFTIVALFKVGSDIDKSQLYLHLDDAMKLKRQNHIDGMRIRFNDLFAAPRGLQNLIAISGDSNFYAHSWMRRQGNLYEAIRTQKTTMFLLLLMLVAVAAFNVVSNLMMTVNDKHADIAILRTIGASPGSVRKIFMFLGSFVGAAGVSLGILLGLLLTVYLSDIYRIIDDKFSLGLMDEYFIQFLPTKILWSDITVIAVVSFVICFLATIYPATKASAANPVETLQYDG